MMSIILYPWLIENRFLHNYNLGVIFVLWEREKSYQQFKNIIDIKWRVNLNQKSNIFVDSTKSIIQKLATLIIEGSNFSV